MQRPAEPVLSDVARQVRARGFAHVPSLGVTTAELREAQDLLDGLFSRFDQLPEDKAVDLGVGGTREAPVVPEVLDCSVFEPRLRQTAVWRAAHRVARDVLGPDVHATYDHAIYKPPGLAGVTSWHQDAAFDLEQDHGLAVWVPFQDTAVQDGCMRYVPRSHLDGLVPHALRTGPAGKEVFYLDVADESAEDVPCSLGGATVHDFYTFHGAGSNLGSSVRRAWVLDFSTSPLPRRVARKVKRAAFSLIGR